MVDTDNVLSLLSYVRIHGEVNYLTLAEGHLSIKFKTKFSQKPFDQLKPNFTCTILGREKQIYKKCFTCADPEGGGNRGYGPPPPLEFENFT